MRGRRPRPPVTEQFRVLITRARAVCVSRPGHMCSFTKFPAGNLQMVARDASTSDAHTHTVRAHTHNKRGSGGSHAQGHRPRKQTCIRRSRAACDRMRQLPVFQKTNDVSLPSLSPLYSHSTLIPCRCESSLRVLPRVVCKISHWMKLC